MTHIMTALLFYYLGHTPHPDPAFEAALRYLAGPALGEQMQDVEAEIDRILQVPEEKETA